MNAGKKLSLLIVVWCMQFQIINGQTFNLSANDIESGLLKKNVPYSHSNGKDSKQIKQYLRTANENMEVNANLSFDLLNKALQLSLKNRVPEYISLSIEGLGDYYIQTECFEKAVEAYLLCLKIEEKYKNIDRVGIMFSQLGFIYNNMEQTKKAMTYLEKALYIFQDKNDTLNQALTLSKIGRAYFDRNFWEKNTPVKKRANYETSLRYYQKALSLLQKTDKLEIMANTNIAVSYVYNMLSQYTNAETCLKKGIEIYIKNKKYPKIGEALYVLGNTYKQRGEYDKAIVYITQALDTAKKYKSSGMHWIYEKLAETYYAAKDYKTSHDMYIKYINSRDSILTLERSKQILDMETQYQTEKKEAEIIHLLKEKKLYGIIAFSVVFSLLTMIIALFLKHKNIKTKKQLIEQKVIQLEQEKKLMVTQAVLEGEETERTRLANDLHDGLGGLLSGVKLNLSAMKENSLLSSENAAAFNKTIGLLDNSIRELRRIAHNLIPENLMRLGLGYAISEFVHSFNMDKPQISFHFYGEETRYAKELELTVYRITQELVNNAVKHSGASTINVQLIMENERINVQVIDDGTSFDTSIIENMSKGTGLQQIKNRVNALNGRFEIVSKPNEGTEAYIEFSSN